MIVNGRGPATRETWVGSKNVSLAVNDQKYTVRPVNISSTGALVHSDDRIPDLWVGDYCRLLSYTESGIEDFSADCRIARIGEQAPFEIGLEFDAVELSTTDALFETGKIRRDLEWDDLLDPVDDDSLP